MNDDREQGRTLKEYLTEHYKSDGASNAEARSLAASAEHEIVTKVFAPMASEETIEKARLAFIEAWERKSVEQEETRRIPGERSRAGIEAAFAVFRQSEPSDAQVEAAAQAMFEPDGPGGEYTWAQMVAEDVSRADLWREDARKVLRAARGLR